MRCIFGQSVFKLMHAGDDVLLRFGENLYYSHKFQDGGLPLCVFFGMLSVMVEDGVLHLLRGSFVIGFGSLSPWCYDGLVNI